MDEIFDFIGFVIVREIGRDFQGTVTGAFFQPIGGTPLFWLELGVLAKDAIDRKKVLRSIATICSAFGRGGNARGCRGIDGIVGEGRKRRLLSEPVEN